MKKKEIAMLEAELARVKESQSDVAYFKSLNDELREQIQRLQLQLQTKNEEKQFLQKPAESIITDAVGTPQLMRKALVTAGLGQGFLI